MTGQPSRTVTRGRCVACGAKFRAARRDARYCSGRCRQRAQRARAEQDDLLRQIEEAKRRYWGLIRRYAEALGVSEARVLAGEAQFADEAGNVWIRGRLAGHAAPPRDGRAAWGLEAAGPPWSPPTDWIHEQFGPERVSSDPAWRDQLRQPGPGCAAGHPDADGPRTLPDGSPALPPHERHFTTIVADPPWRYDNRASRGAAEDHYPTMPVDELSGLLGAVTARDGYTSEDATP